MSGTGWPFGLARVSLWEGMMFLREWRKRVGMSQTKLHELSGVSRQWIIAIEQGKVKKARPETKESLAAALGIETADLDRQPEAGDD